MTYGERFMSRACLITLCRGRQPWVPGDAKSPLQGESFSRHDIIKRTRLDGEFADGGLRRQLPYSRFPGPGHRQLLRLVPPLHWHQCHPGSPCGFPIDSRPLRLNRSCAKTSLLTPLCPAPATANRRARRSMFKLLLRTLAVWTPSPKQCMVRRPIASEK